jgi:excisionase family DNA binding protein
VSVEAPSSQLLTTGEAARLAGVSAETIRMWARSGRLPVQRTARGLCVYQRDDIDRIVARRQALAHALAAQHGDAA